MERCVSCCSSRLGLHTGQEDLEMKQTATPAALGGWKLAKCNHQHVNAHWQANSC